MKKSILNIGTVLNRAEQKQINGGNFEEGDVILCNIDDINTCPQGMTCDITQPFSGTHDGVCVANGDGSPGSGSGGICPHNVGQNCDSPI